MKRFSLVLLGAVGAFLVLTPAQAADYRVIQYNDTRICQIYDMTWQIKPFTSNYKVLTKKSLPTFAAAVDTKTKIAKQANCLI
jgi:hypothetical protein